ncbi:MAG: S1C family serine protease [Luteolibacter sp.]|uniref:S1C family serine protease n=1 Tax=Luteolibacter sp. TaxID=1962973 RepID=UPI00326718F2
MKSRHIIALLFAQTLLSAAEPAELKGLRPALSNQAPRAWLGLQVSKPDATTTAHVPSLPPGVGFVVKSVDEAGPAKAAGFQEFDLIWKFGDQMLINEAQLATLLRLAKPGEEVALSGFRAGKPLELKLKLGEAPSLVRPFGGEFAEAAVLPGVSGGPMRVVNVSEKIASFKEDEFTEDERTATVHREGDVYKIKIQGAKNLVIYEGELSKDGGLDKIPENWRRKIQVLCRTLDQAIDGNTETERQPRPRVVPPALPNP